MTRRVPSEGPLDTHHHKRPQRRLDLIMSSSSSCRWHEECLGRCEECTTTCLSQGAARVGRQSCSGDDVGLYKRFVTMGSVRYGMRLGAVSPPPPGAGPRYRSQQCCWPTTSVSSSSSSAGPGGGGGPVGGPVVSRIPLLATAPINSFDIISCANRVRMTEDDDATSELAQQATTVRDHDVLYSTKCLLKSQLKRCALVRPQIYSRLCEYGGDGGIGGNGGGNNGINEETTNILNTLDRLPRFRFGGNRANGKGNRDYDKNNRGSNNNEQRLKDLNERLKRTPIPPPRTKHTSRTNTNTQEDESMRATPLRSASFSQVDYSSDDKKYVRRRYPPGNGETGSGNGDGSNGNNHNNRGVATLPRSRNVPRCTVSSIETTSSVPLESQQLQETAEPQTQDTDSKSHPVQDKQPVIRNSTLSPSTAPETRPETSVVQDKKRDRSKRRKGIYISQWPNTYSSTENVIPQFVEDGDFASCSGKGTKLLEESIAKISELQVNDDKREFPIWSSPQEEPLSPEDNTVPPEWPRSKTASQSPDEKDNFLRISSRGIQLVRTDSLSEGEPEIGERKSDHIVPSDVSDCESRISIGNDSASPCVARRYSKRPLRGPYGQMLEAEMKKPETNRKNHISTDLKFLEDLSVPQPDKDSKPKCTRSRSSCNSSLDETHSKNLYVAPLKQNQPLSKRKVSADNLVIPNDNSHKVVVSHQRTISSPSKLERFANTEVSTSLLEQLLRGSSEQIATSDASLQHQKNDTRTHVVVELYDNERSYVESLQILVTKYLEPLKSPENSNLLDSTLVDDIFYQIPFLLSHHQVFLDELKDRLERWDVKQKIGDVFLEMFSKPSVIESYTNYVNNWKKARDIIKTSQQSKPAFAKFLETTAREHKGKLALDSLLIKPIQKFPKYELLLQRLIKHTDVNHPDHCLLLAAQREVHDQLLKINCLEREMVELEQLRDIEGLIDGLIELAAPDRQFLRHDLVSIVGSGGTRKERALFLFSDLLLVTSIKRKSGTIRKPMMVLGSVASTIDANKYKLLMKIALEDLEIIKSKDENLKQIMIEINDLSADIRVLNQIHQLAWSLHCNRNQLDDLIKDMLSSLNRQLTEQQNSNSQLSCLDLALNTPNGPETISMVFTKPEKRSSWEESFNEAKHKLATSSDRSTCPELLATVPIRKTRAGLQFTCAAPTLGDNGKDVWVCNSDGYVGQVCVLSLLPEATVTSCNGVCNARILCIASVPGISYSLSVNNRANNNSEGSEEHKAVQFDSSSSSDEDDKSDDETDEGQKKNDGDSTSLELDEIDSQQSTMWLGTEDGCIHVYNSSDTIRIKKNKIRLQHGSAILCIIYVDNKVFVSLASGDIVIYERDSSGGWNVNSPTTVSVGSISTPVSKMLPNAGKLWCGCGSTIKIFDTQTLVTENSFTINNDNNKPVSCIVMSGKSVWLSLQNSSVIKCFHTLTFESLCEVNVATAVTKMLISCDDIIRQHKAACLRVTSLLACKDLLWIGTSAGVILTMPLPHITPSTTKLTTVPTVSGVSHGHTGQVRFLTYVELTTNPMSCSEPSKLGQESRNSHHSKTKQDQKNHTKMLVISGGDGYEDFRSSNLSEVAGREDSTNHLLLWNI